MLATLGIVQFPLRPSERSLPRQSISLTRRKLGGKSLLEWVVRRVTESQRLDGVIVVVGDTPEQRRIAELVPPDVPIFVGKQADPLADFAAALREFRSKGVVRVCVDNPFIDPVLIDRLVTAAESYPDCDYISYCFRDGRPAVQSPLGVFAEWCRVGAVQEADRNASDAVDRMQVTRYVYSRPDRFQLRLIPVPPELDRDDVRLTIDVDEDWEHAQVIFDALGP